MIDDSGRFHHYNQRQQEGRNGSRSKLTFNVNELKTTDTLLNAIAAAAIIGCKWNPQGRKKPIARGIMNTL
jgi:hypothetical protein